MSFKEWQLYLVDGGSYYADYGALSFEEMGHGKEVKEFCESLLKGDDKVDVDHEEYGSFGLRKIHTTIDGDAFLRTRQLGDYDSSKHEKIYIEGEIIGQVKTSN